jgi:hypothetical protein
MLMNVIANLGIPELIYMTSTQNNIRRVVMRRVYTLFAARLVSHPLTLHGALFAAALVVFAEVVHVKRVVETLEVMPVARMPEFVLSRLMDGEVLTLIALGVLIFSALSIPWQFRRLVPVVWHRSEVAS